MIEVVCGVLIQNGKCLIARRNYGSSKGFYEFPGGKVESNETKEEALKREWKEELGIEIKIFLILLQVKTNKIMPFL
jgi:8-oxo-dGTP diphosphatase